MQATQTNGDVTGAMRLEELVEMLPHTWNPLHHIFCPSVSPSSRRCFTATATPGPNLGVGKASSKVSCEESMNRFHVVGTEDPAEVVVQLKIGW